MESERRGIMTGMFRDRDSAEQAWRSLSERGYGRDDVSLLMSDDTRQRHFGDASRNTELGDKAAEGATAGALIGGSLGAVLMGLAATGAIALPGLGLLAMGPLAAALTGAAGGGLAGGLLGALIGAGIPEDRAREYESGIRNGGIVMGVHPRTDEDADYFEREWTNYRGEQIYRPQYRKRDAA